ncbi:CPBP family intramembrane glutamic endopeptidase [Pseudomonas sp. TE3610]
MPAPRLLALLLLTTGYALALCFGALDSDAIPVFALLTVVAFAAYQPRLKPLAHTLFILLALALAAHLLPGFDNALVIDRQVMSPDAPPFSMALNLDKPLIGFWLLLACPWTVPNTPWRQAAQATVVTLAATSAVVFGLALAVGAVAWQPKWPANGGLWLLNNLLLVCIVEELLFRGYLQQALQRYLPGAMAIAITALLFGATHLAGGWQWAVLATLAGIGYGLAFKRGGLWAAIACHLGLNLLHFSLFSYPLAI